ncbi:MAG: molybdopterin-dependent oxidoreductase [Deltaproteobacteria bacterium]|nr:molybdopterin-dependent oxidoreductase [Deltaproteobacteria bacterium]
MSDSTIPKLTRRTTLGALATGTLLEGCNHWKDPAHDPTGHALVKPHVPGAETFFTHEERWVNTSCDQCPSGCGVRVRVVEGRAVRIEGNPSNPLNRGGIGARGLAGLQTLYDPDRIRTPLRRVEGKLVPVSWDDALDELAKSLRSVRGSSPERLLVLSGRERGFTHELLQRFCRAFGTPNFVDGRSSHSAATIQAMSTCLGVPEAPAIAWEGADFILSLEAALVEDSCRSVYMARAAATMRRDRARRVHLVHAGPLFDLAAYNADQWLRIRPGTSGALALGICHQLIAAGTYDQELVARGRDFDDFRAFSGKFSPEYVEEVTGVAPNQLIDLSRAIWARRPSLVVTDERSLSFSNGLDTACAVLALNLLLGSIQRSGCGIRSAAKPPLFDWFEVPADEIAERGAIRPSLDGAGTEFPTAASVIDALPEAMAKRVPAVALLYHSNPTYARPQPMRWREALSKVPLVVSFSPFVDETVADVAHLVLPDHTYLERTEEAIPAPGSARGVVGLRRAVVSALFDTRPTGEVIIDLAQRVGGSVRHSFPWKSHREAVEARLLGLQAASRGSIVESTPAAFFREMIEEGFWTELDDEPLKSVNFRFQSAWELPKFAGEPTLYPLELLAYRPLGYAEGSGANQPWLRTLRPRPGTKNWSLGVSIHPEDVPFLARDGDLVRVESAFGVIELPLALDRWIRRGCVAIPMGGGHRAFGRWAEGFSANVMDLLAPTPAPDTGSSLLAATRVRIKPIEVT